MSGRVEFALQYFLQEGIFIVMKAKDYLTETFGDPIGSYAGNAPAGVMVTREAGMACGKCGMMPQTVESDCGCGGMEPETCEMCGMSVDQCMCQQAATCPACGMMPLQLDAPCECAMMEAKKGPSKSTAKKILKGAVTATQKAKKVDSWATNPWAAANWMSKEAGVPFHGKKK
jgi:hypothetical protein